MEDICAMLAGLFYFTVWIQFFALPDYVTMASYNHQFSLLYFFFTGLSIYQVTEKHVHEET